jgi:hypothetical protein
MINLHYNANTFILRKEKEMKRLRLFIAIMVATATMSITAFAGQWKQDNIGWWYQNDDGSYAANLIKQIDGPWYYFDSTGYMKTGSYHLLDGWYSFREDGSCSNPISQTDGTPVGAPGEGWVKYSGNISSATQEISDGRVVYYNNMYWASPDYVNDLKDLAERDIVTRETTNSLTPGAIIDFSK